MARVDIPMPCLRCRYDLRGAEALGRCPECGLAVATTLASSTAPRARVLAALRRPRRVALLVLAAGLGQFLCVMLQLAAPMLSTATLLTGMNETFSHHVRFWGWTLSAMVLAGAAACSHACVDRAEGPLRAEMGRWRGLLSVGLWAWTLAAAGAAFAAWQAPFLPDVWRSALPWIGVATQLPGMTVAMAAFGVLLGIVGRRSLAFTESGAARQGVHLVNSVAAITLVTSLASFWLRGRQDADWMLWLHLLLLVASVCLAGLLLLGSAYLLSNSWLVARALVLPPPRLEDAIRDD